MSAKRGIIGGVITLVTLFVFFQGFFFVFHPTRGAAYPFSYGVLMPVMVVEGVPVSYHRVARFTNELLSAGVFENHEEAFQTALSRSADNAAVRALARELRVEMSAAEREAQGETAFEKEYVNAPLLVSQKTEAAVLKDADYQREPRERLEKMRERFADGTLPFADAAPRFSEDVSGGNGGDLGVFTVSALPAWLASTVSLEKGEVSAVLEGPDAFWLMEVSDRSAEESEEPWIRLRGIAAKKVTLQAVLADRLAANHPWVFVW
jgi:hypothetical protein